MWMAREQALVSCMVMWPTGQRPRRTPSGQDGPWPSRGIAPRWLAHMLTRVAHPHHEHKQHTATIPTPSRSPQSNTHTPTHAPKTCCTVCRCHPATGIATHPHLRQKPPDGVYMPRNDGVHEGGLVGAGRCKEEVGGPILQRGNAVALMGPLMAPKEQRNAAIADPNAGPRRSKPCQP